MLCNAFENYKVGGSLERRHYSSHLRPEITAAEKLTLTLRYLAAGVSQVSIQMHGICNGFV